MKWLKLGRALRTDSLYDRNCCHDVFSRIIPSVSFHFESDAKEPRVDYPVSVFMENDTRVRVEKATKVTAIDE